MEQKTLTRRVVVAATQMSCSDVHAENIKKAEKLVREAHAKGAQIILLQELFENLYFCQHQKESLFDLAGPCDVEKNPLLKHFALLSAELNVVLPISFFERAQTAFYNSIVVFDAGRLLGLYRKSHIPDGPGYQEKYYFNPGDTGFKVFHTQFGSIGVGICWDQWFPECARAMALKGAELLFYPTAIGSEPQDPTLHSRDHWTRVMQGHAGANVMPLICSNRIGKEYDITFYGGTFIADHTGKQLSVMDDKTEGVMLQEFDLEKLRLTRASWGVFRDRRPALYLPLLSLDGKEPSSLEQVGRCTPAEQPVARKTLSPAADGFRMPGEFEPQQRCFIAWPFRTDNWREGAAPAQKAFTEVASQLSLFQPVTVLAHPSQYESARASLPKRVKVVEMSYNDSWLRDIGPTFVVNDVTGEVRGIHWKFNGWGGNCYGDTKLDESVGSKVVEAMDCERYDCPLVMEGGSFHVDGQGTLITTEECVLNANRSLAGDAPRTKESLERLFADYLGVTTCIWLPNGLVDDHDTDGHIDNLCCFVKPGHVALAWTDNQADPNYAVCQKAFAILSSSTDAKGQRLTVHKIPMPENLSYSEHEIKGIDSAGSSLQRSAGQRLAASYINFYIGNDVVLLPGFGASTDEAAKEAVQKLFPAHRVVQVPSREILLGGGNIHCITQQMPRAPQPKRV